ncbi:2', 3'-cyclic nucleotide 2'-phosphodiesterase [Kiloniella spongiae]|uniref:2', 3'-cyclic nucleotide 2'-phosphodiesterase n=1 Tax=Kiloniella spongiae TaxID=1489064 RepID=A0A0H2MRN5_9PROT|nr:bifunctional 2',3'-cyclic-nucleotide 2'-phosphodiesterase/3'-nucleotidase [Kiloniella spongiae]KLN59350.1 2', 3'-cyclic nucleotide 2'-phosphodiesterase [Kiloniella spongiae]
MKKILLAGAGVLALGLGTAHSAEVQLRILETTDIHVHVVDYDYYKDAPSVAVGLSRTATLIKEARQEATNSLLIDNGDLIQGNPLGDYMAKERGLKEGEVHPVFKAMNLLKYDVGNLGNHEFNYGLDFLSETLNDAAFPYVSANVFIDDGDNDPGNDKPAYDPYIILDREVVDTEGNQHNIKVGVIGFLPPQITQWDEANLKGKLVTHDIVDTAKRYVPEMKEKGADVIIAVPHSGLSDVTPQGRDENATYHLSKVEGLDAILFGHAHAVFPSETYKDIAGVDIEKGTINGVAATMPGFWGSHLGLVDLTLDVDDNGNWKVVDSIGSTRGIYKRDGRKKLPLVEADQTIVDAVKHEHEETIEFMRKAVGTTSAPINSFFALVQDDPSIQIVTNAQKWYVEKLIKGTEYDGIPVLSAGAPFKAGGRGGADYYTNIATGEIALKNVADLYIYPNTLRAVLLNGAQVREWLEMSAGAFNQIDKTQTEEQVLLNPSFPSYNFDVIDGVEYSVDLTQPARYNKEGQVVNPDSHRIIDMTYQGKPLDMDAQFIVATNNYRAHGGGSFPALDGSTVIIQAPDENRTVLANYIFDQKKIDPSADKNWGFAPIKEDVNVTFETTPSAKDILGNKDVISYIGEGKDGFGKYQISFE